MDAAPSINLPQSLPVWPTGSTPLPSPEDGVFPTLTHYLPSEEFRTGQSVLIFPGGGYGGLSSAKEGHRPAQLLAANGIAAAVLEYRHAPQKHPVPLMDAQRALRIVRQQAELHDGLDPAQVGCMGFSAGGHLAGSLATQPEVSEGLVGDHLDSVPFKPDFFAVVYAVLSFGEPHTHLGSQHNLLGENASEDQIKLLSIEKAVSADTPPCFITHGQGDAAVPVENAIVLYQALTRYQIPATLFLFEEDAHGIGMAANHSWAQRLLDWLGERG
ncbi:MAG: alpha/beta hydrolase [Coraliomargarita sp.]